MVEDIEEFHARRLNAQDVLTPKNGEQFLFPIADATAKICGGDEGLRIST